MKQVFYNHLHRNRWASGGHDQTAIHGFYGGGTEDIAHTEPFVLDADAKTLEALSKNSPVFDIVTNPVPVSVSVIAK